MAGPAARNMVDASSGASTIKPWTTVAAAFEPAAIALATDGICEFRSPAAESPETLVLPIESTWTASPDTGPAVTVAAPSCPASVVR